MKDKFLDNLDKPYNELEGLYPEVLFLNTMESSIKIAVSGFNTAFVNSTIKAGSAKNKDQMMSIMDMVGEVTVHITSRSAFMAGIKFEDTMKTIVEECAEKFVELGLDNALSNVCASIVGSHKIIHEVCGSALKDQKVETKDDIGRSICIRIIMAAVQKNLELMETALKSDKDSDVIKELKSRGVRGMYEEDINMYRDSDKPKDNKDKSNDKPDVPDAFLKAFED